MMKTDSFLLEPMNQDYIDGKIPSPPVNSLTQQHKLGGIVVLCFSLVLALFSAYSWHSVYPLMTEGQVTQGKLLGLAEQPGTGKYQKVVFEFTDPQGKQVRFVQSLKHYLLHDMPPNTPVKVRFLPRDPSKAYLEARFWRDRVGSAWVATAGTLGLLLLSLWSLGMAALMKRKTLLMAKSSIILEGEITKINGHTDKIGYYVTARYQFTPPGKSPIQGKNSCYRDDLVEKGLPEVGSKVKVLFHDLKNYQML